MGRLTNKELMEGHVTYGINERSVQYLPPYERYMVEKLKEYEDLEEQGLLLRLPVPAVHGTWEKYGYKYKCSACGSKINIDGTPEENGLYFCPKCGADMRKKV